MVKRTKHSRSTEVAEDEDQDRAAEEAAIAAAVGDACLQEYYKESKKLYESMVKQIDRLANRCKCFSNINEIGDYAQEAYIACSDATLRYSRYHKRKPDPQYVPTEITDEEIAEASKLWDITNDEALSIMRMETYAHWYISKRLFRLATAEGIEYEIRDKDNNYITTMNNNEYRKNKKALTDKGCKANSYRPTKHFCELSSKTDNGGIREFEPAVDFVEPADFEEELG